MNFVGFLFGKFLLGLVLVLGLVFRRVEILRETNFVGEAFAVEWAIFVGWAPDWEGF